MLDRFSEVFDLLEPWADEDFYNFNDIDPDPGSIVVVGRQSYLDNQSKFKNMAQAALHVMVFDNLAEGSWTLQGQLRQIGLDSLVEQRRALVLGGAEIDARYPCLPVDHFLLRVLDYPENVAAQKHTLDIFQKKHKPYCCLFLNGRARPHRKYLYERFRVAGMLDRMLYTMLDRKPNMFGHFDLYHEGQNLMDLTTELRRLPDQYEMERYRDPVFGPITTSSNIKQELFRLEWGEIYLKPEPYIDTYFSLVTETVCAESDFSFRTEKIAKPLAIGHPFVVAANRGFYRDLRSIGFRTFDHVIDESFDLIDNAQDRMDRLFDVVRDLCDQDLDAFIAECQDVCKYNQQHLVEYIQTTRDSFPARFFQFIHDNE